MWKRIIFIPIIATLIAGVFSPTHLGILDKPKPKPQTKATKEQKIANKKMAIQFASAGYGWDSKQQVCIVKLFTAESRFDHLAKNLQGSSAYGIGQMLNEKSSDPAIQILRSYKYIKKRYSTPCRAWSFHLRHNYY